MTQDFYSTAEEAYVVQRGKLIDLIRKLQNPSRSEPSEKATAVHTAPKSTLPRIQLPHFAGKYEDWPSFKDLF